MLKKLPNSKEQTLNAHVLLSVKSDQKRAAKNLYHFSHSFPILFPLSLPYISPGQILYKYPSSIFLFFDLLGSRTGIEKFLMVFY